MTSADRAPVKGYFYALCKHWGQIIIDGDTVDTTPMREPLTLAPGRHQIEFFNPNFKLHRWTVATRSGETNTVHVLLNATHGSLMVQVVPWAKVYIDGEYKEDTPLSKPLILTSGTHELKLVNPSFGEMIDSIFIELDKTLEKQFTLKQQN